MLLKRGYHTIGRIKSNRVIYPFGIKTSVKEFSTHIRKNETCLVTVGDNNYYVYRYEGKINDLENAVILICWSKPILSDKPAFIVSTDVSLTTSVFLNITRTAGILRSATGIIRIHLVLMNTR